MVTRTKTKAPDKPESITPLGKRLLERRIKLGIGLRDLARRVELSPTYLSRIMTGNEQSPPSEDSLRALAKALDVPLDELLCLAGRIPSDVIGVLTADRDWWKAIRYAARKGISGADVGDALARNQAAKLRALFSPVDEDFADS